jgi:hypothetical protein
MSRTELAIVLLIVGTQGFCVWSFIPRGSFGLAVPTVPPDESRRHYFFKLGLSMVLPPDWESSSTGRFLVTPRNPGPPRRSRALIVVSSLGHHRPPGIEEMARVEFQGHEAYEQMMIVRAWSFDDGAFSEYTMYFPRGDDWYEIKYGIAEERTVLPAIIRQYLETLQWNTDVPE